MLRRLCMIVLAAGIAPSALAESTKINLFVFENADNADVSGLDLWVDIINQGSSADFVFHNDSSIASFVSSIYIEETDFSDDGLEDGEITAQSTGVKFSEGATPPNPPGAIKNFGGKWQGNLFAADAESPGTNKDGIDPGESLTVRFELDNISFQDLIDAICGDVPSFRIAQHVQGLPGGESVWTLNDDVRNDGTGDPILAPLPSAAGMSLAGLALLAARRRR